MKRVLVNPKQTQPMYDAFHFSQANPVGDTIWDSEQVGIDSGLSPASGMAAQARLAFEGLKRTLAETGASLGCYLRVLPPILSHLLLQLVEQHRGQHLISH